MGRPSKFTQALAEKICERIADRESLRSICRDEEMPAKSTVLSWLADEGKAAFRARYALAREILADDRSNDWIEKKNAAGETTGWQENGEAIRRSQLRIATRQWVAEKLKPKKYGAKVEPEQSVTGEVSQLLEDINGRTRGLPNGG
ncbi:terminase small subunit protein [Rhizobium sp. BJ04]|uniref:terminase small subunit-like protein n=1 Tax=Rhizobium binxianense TaxID=3024242 RepID=UPI0023AA1420|nr:terminase small subunit protein [Rhizobium sp. BJ04]WEA60962.1 terminase small subunit protein [Rhizobium sp. BJ04]